MIVRKSEHWFKMLFIWKGSVLPQLLPRLLLLFTLATGIVILKGNVLNHKIPLNPLPFTIFGIALAIFLGFRNSVSYDRFWEGRKLWGALLNTTRSLARQALTRSGYNEDSDEVHTFINYLIAFTYALKHQLRGTDALGDLSQILPPNLFMTITEAKYKPVMITKAMADWIKSAKDKKLIDSIAHSAFDENLNKLSDITGGCERISSTPIPYTYRVLLHRTVYTYCFLLPFGFVDSLGWIMPFIVVFIAYTFVALEAIADEIEEPFGTEPNDLALNAMTEMIEDTILEMANRPTPARLENTSQLID